MTTPAPPVEPPASRESAPRRRRWWWLPALAAAWAVALVGVGVLSFHRDAPTVREQRTVAQAAPVVDRATGEIVAATLGTPAAVEISGRRLSTGCRLTSAWDGAELARELVARAKPEDAPGILDQIADRLPASYRATVRHSDLGGVHRLRADAGDFVAINGGVTSPGVISLTVRTGCRPPSPAFDPDEGEPVRSHADATAVADLIAVDVDDVEVVDVAVVPCPGGEGVFVGATATGRGELGGVVRDVVTRQGLPVIVAEPDHLAFRVGLGTVDVRSANGMLTAATVQARCTP